MRSDKKKEEEREALPFFSHGKILRISRETKGAPVCRGRAGIKAGSLKNYFINIL